jgi:MIP family channel proteins
LENQEWWKPCVAEFIGTFALIYIGAGAVIASNGSNLVAIALAHGLAIAVMVTALGHISGAHFNPAVTAAMLVTRKIQVELGLLYIIFQLLGGVFGAFMLVVSFPRSIWGPVTLGTPMVTGITESAAVIVEAILTFFLVFVIFGAAVDGRNVFKPVAGLAIGFTIAADIMIGGPITGAAMNPARAFGPALIAKSWGDHLIYWIGPLFGAITAGLVYDIAFLQRAKPKESPPESPTPPPAEGQRE